MMQTDQLRKVAPLWLQYTEDVRADPDAWKLSGDQYATKPGDKPWISEMYGYSFACAKADVWHKVRMHPFVVGFSTGWGVRAPSVAELHGGHRATLPVRSPITHSVFLSSASNAQTPLGMMRYPGYDVQTPPHVLHYGLLWNVGDDYAFDKHWYYNFDPFLCPPWNLDNSKSGDEMQRANKGGLFPHPPSPASFKTDGLALLADLLSVEPVIILNAALCERHLVKCSPSPELERQCARAKSLEAELDERLAALLPGLPDPCENSHPKCEQWALSGECAKNPTYMMNKCVKACGFCFGGADKPVVLEADAHSVDTEQVAGRGAWASSGTDVLEDAYEDNTGDQSNGDDADDDGEEYEDYEGDEGDEGDTGGGGQGRGVSRDVPDGVLEHLLGRCRQNAAVWRAHEVTECVELAKQGIMYQHLDAGTSSSTSTTTPSSTTQTAAIGAESAPMSLASIIAANLNMKEKLLLGACGSYLAWYVVSRRQGGAASRLSRYRKQLRDRSERLPVRARAAC